MKDFVEYDLAIPETKDVIGAAMEVVNTLGHGLLEKPYENAMCVELGLRGLGFEQQSRYPVLYKSVLVGEYVPDIIVAGKVVVDTKTIDRITDHELGQMMNYLRITGLPVGLIINFKYARLQWKRVAFTRG
ncbi:MAG: GxxExxY protein [Bacteroidetes bacterium]|nr:GxxExxY protein [Bacteroidota bacterium]